MMLVAFVSFTSAVQVASWDDIGFDTISRQLNDRITRNPGCTFCGGTGVLVRSPLDGFENDDSKVSVPATFWTNDLFVPTALYPGNGANGNPMCPTSLFACESDVNTGEDGPWDYAQLAVVIGNNMGTFMPDFDNIQNEDWGWGVFYPTDSNAVDQRCRWLEDGNGYDCIGGWIDGSTGAWTDHSDRGGTGGYTPGNPNAGLGGGGAGCHAAGHEIDQTNAYSWDGQNLIQDHDCQCNYGWHGSWDGWVDAFMNGWHGPMYSLDYASCWVNNLRDMIDLQNAIWWRRTDWADGSTPWAPLGYGGGVLPASDGDGDRRYWGWNEIPVLKADVNSPDNWDAVLIKLPAAMDGYGEGDRLSMLDYYHGLALEDALNNYVYNAKFLFPGRDNLVNRPGSYVVLVREYADASGNYAREFFCETWMSPSSKYQIIYDAGCDCCYIDWGGGSAQAAELSV